MGGGGGGEDQDTLALAGVAAREGVGNSGGGLTVGSVILGDGGVNQVLRGFLSFDLSPIPAGATVVSATLQLSQFLVFGEPFAELGSMVADHVDLGAALDIADFSAAPLQSAVATLFTTPALGTILVDVTSSVLDDLGDGRTRTEFRLRFTTDTNMDGGQDSTQVGCTSTDDDTQPPLRLIVTFTP